MFRYLADAQWAASTGWTSQATATVVVGAIAFVTAVVGVYQKWRTDRRDHWWSRTQWALDQLARGEESRTVGIEVLSDQLDSSLATGSDYELLDRVMDIVLTSHEGRPDE